MTKERIRRALEVALYADAAGADENRNMLDQLMTELEKCDHRNDKVMAIVKIEKLPIISGSCYQGWPISFRCECGDYVKPIGYEGEKK